MRALWNAERSESVSTQHSRRYHGRCTEQRSARVIKIGPGNPSRNGSCRDALSGKGSWTTLSFRSRSCVRSQGNCRRFADFRSAVWCNSRRHAPWKCLSPDRPSGGPAASCRRILDVSRESFCAAGDGRKDSDCRCRLRERNRRKGPRRIVGDADHLARTIPKTFRADALTDVRCIKTNGKRQRRSHRWEYRTRNLHTGQRLRTGPRFYSQVRSALCNRFENPWSTEERIYFHRKGRRERQIERPLHDRQTIGSNSRRTEWKGSRDSGEHKKNRWCYDNESRSISAFLSRAAIHQSTEVSGSRGWIQSRNFTGSWIQPRVLLAYVCHFLDQQQTCIGKFCWNIHASGQASWKRAQLRARIQSICGRSWCEECNCNYKKIDRTVSGRERGFISYWWLVLSQWWLRNRDQLFQEGSRAGSDIRALLSASLLVLSGNTAARGTASDGKGLCGKNQFRNRLWVVEPGVRAVEWFQ